LRFQLQMPPGWRTENLKQAVVAVSPEQDAAIMLGLAPAPSAQQAAQKFFTQNGVRSGGVDATRLNGLPAVIGRFQAQTQNGTVAGVASFIEQDGRVYQMMAYADARRFDVRRNALEQAVASFAPLRDPRAIAVQPPRVDVVRVPSDMTLAEFHSRYPSTVPLETVRIINHLEPGEQLQGGHLYKRVTGAIPAAG
jgi:predicted Zn-dependent protease